MKVKIRNKLLMSLDIVLINISIAMAFLLRFDFSFKNIPREFINNLSIIFISATLIKLACFIIFKIYNSLWKYAGIYEVFYIVIATLISNLVIFSYLFISKIKVPRSIFIIEFFIGIFLIIGVRFLYRVLRRIVKGEIIRIKDLKRILIIGAGDAGASVVRGLKLHNQLKSKPIAIIDIDVYNLGKKVNGVPIIGTIKDIAKIINDKKIDEVIIALPDTKGSELNQIYEECEKTKCNVKILPSLLELMDESVAIQKIRDVDISDLLGREPVKLDIEEISSYLKDQVILVTGGGGSIGSELCRQVACFSPRKLIILDNYENSAFEIQNELLCKFPKLDLDIVIANIREKSRLENVFKKYSPHVVFHAAAHKHVPLMEANPGEAIRNNVFGTLNVAECADKFNCKKFVLISTDKAVNPTNIMGATKRVAEMIVQAIDKKSETEFVAVRFGNVLGSNGSVIPLFKKQIEQGGPVTVTHPEITRFFMTIPEAVELVIEAGAIANGGEIFVLDMGKPVKIYDLAKKLIKLSGLEPEKDIKIEFTGLRPGEKLYEELLMTEESLKATKNNKIFIAHPVLNDIEKFKTDIENLKNLKLDDSDNLKDYIKNMLPSYLIKAV